MLDGKIKRCQFFEDVQKEDLQLMKGGNTNTTLDESTLLDISTLTACSKYALITFADRALADRAILNERSMMFRDSMLLHVEHAMKSHIFNVVKALSKKGASKIESEIMKMGSVGFMP